MADFSRLKRVPLLNGSHCRPNAHVAPSDERRYSRLPAGDDAFFGQTDSANDCRGPCSRSSRMFANALQCFIQADEIFSAGGCRLIGGQHLCGASVHLPESALCIHLLQPVFIRSSRKCRKQNSPKLTSGVQSKACLMVAEKSRAWRYGLMGVFRLQSNRTNTAR